MKPWIKIIVGLVIIGLLAAIAIYIFVINKPKRDIENEKPSYELTVEKMYTEYTTDAEAANLNYLDKTGIISGSITKIEKSDSLVIVVFALSEGEFGDEGIRCTMLEKYKNEALAINPGTTVEIKGVCTGYNGSDIIFEKCSIKKN